jgi:hypothetical protein
MHGVRNVLHARPDSTALEIIISTHVQHAVLVFT